MPARLNPKIAIARMLKSDAKPLAPYPGSTLPWKCECLRCGKIIYPRLGGISTGQGACVSCGTKARVQKQTMSQESARLRFLESNLELIGEYKGENVKVEAKCVFCGHKNKPTLHDIKKYGCRKCAGRNKRLPLQEIEAIFEKSNLKMIGDYVSGHQKIEAICLGCNSVVFPCLLDLKHNGQGGCSTCANWGFDNSSPSYLYFILNEKRASYKIGIANVTSNKKNDRLHRHLRDGWKEIEVWDFVNGKQARDVEKQILQYLRLKLGIAIHLKKQDMKFQGYSETFSCKDVDIKTVQRILRKSIQEVCQ